MTLTFGANLALELLGTHNLELQAAADEGEDHQGGDGDHDMDDGAFGINSNKVLSLDGDGDYIEIPHSQSLNITGNITLELKQLYANIIHGDDDRYHHWLTFVNTPMPNNIPALEDSEL